LVLFLFSQVACDYGGPQREFFRLILAEIKEKYFDKGIRELLADDYYTVGVIMGMSKILSCTIESSCLQRFPQHLSVVMYTYFEHWLYLCKIGVAKLVPATFLVSRGS